MQHGMMVSSLKPTVRVMNEPKYNLKCVPDKDGVYQLTSEGMVILEGTHQECFDELQVVIKFEMSML